MEQPKVSVIVPVYNVEKYIERCARSLFEQTLESIEYIFVDDCTPDRSILILKEVLNDYPNRQAWTKIIRLPINSRQAAARTAGMKVASGQYQIHCDPDDWVDTNLYEKLYKQACNTNSDITTCRFKRIKEDISKIEGLCFAGTGERCLKEFAFEFSLCSKLISSELIYKHNLFPFEGINCGEDLNVVFRALYYSKKVSFISDAGYNYCYNSNSTTNKGLTNNIETYLIKNIQKLDAFINDVGEYWLNDVLNKIKFSFKAPIFWSNSDFTYRDAKYWCKLWPECHSTVNDLFKYPTSKILSVAVKRPYLLYLYHKYLRMRHK